MLGVVNPAAAANTRGLNFAVLCFVFAFRFLFPLHVELVSKFVRDCGSSTEYLSEFLRDPLIIVWPEELQVHQCYASNGPIKCHV